QAEGVIEAYGLLGADAVEPGETDFALGVDAFRGLAAKAKFTFVSANIHLRSNGKLLLDDSVIVNRQGEKIGIFGVFGAGLELPAELTASDPAEAARHMVEKLRAAGADMVIALAHE